MKRCGVCGAVKPWAEFNRKGKVYQAKCRECQKAYFTKYYGTAENKARMMERNTERRAVTMARVQDLKKEPCTDCGLRYHPVQMDFDHLGDDKTMEISKMVNQMYGWSAILAEIQKCELVCSNCHRLRTHNRKSILG